MTLGGLGGGRSSRSKPRFLPRDLGLAFAWWTKWRVNSCGGIKRPPTRPSAVSRRTSFVAEVTVENGGDSELDREQVKLSKTEKSDQRVALSYIVT